CGFLEVHFLIHHYAARGWKSTKNLKIIPRGIADTSRVKDNTPRNPVTAVLRPQAVLTMDGFTYSRM
ncbi:MAG: hypothetical protein NT069_06800, partial [Planctomycetota bacterium]|nr:hypothetical protein [Planctomycetota bacterium]